MGLDEEIRLRAFEWLKGQQGIHGDVLPRELLEKGFEFEGERIPLIAPQGIFRPRFLELPLSITTAPKGPYNDSHSSDGYLLYKYRGTDPLHRDNVGLRQAMIKNTPLVYFYGLVPGRYLATWPVYIVGDDSSSLTFKVAVDDAGMESMQGESWVGEAANVRRAYITTAVRQRLHQRSFRERVIRAYRDQCALCRLRHHELLDAAHIIPDAEPKGLPSVRNGISLCKFHHAAFDAQLLGITPEYAIQIRSDVLKEEDGPMLQHALKELHGSRIVLPRDKNSWPDKAALDIRYQRFRLAS
jgi:putative restriction endonuclease